MIIKVITDKCFPFLSKKNIKLWDKTITNIFDRDSNLKTCLQPELGAQKVENHWTRGRAGWSSPNNYLNGERRLNLLNRSHVPLIFLSPDNNNNNNNNNNRHDDRLLDRLPDANLQGCTTRSKKIVSSQIQKLHCIDIIESSFKDFLS